MAHKKGVGSSRNGRDSNPQMLGVKRFGGQFVTAGSILVGPRGTRLYAGLQIGVGGAHTPFAKAPRDSAVRRPGVGKIVSVSPSPPPHPAAPSLSPRGPQV